MKELNNLSTFELVESAEFGGSQVDIYRNGNEEVFMTAKQLGEALEYSNPDIAINKIINRNDYLKDKEFSVLTNLVSTDGKTYNTRLMTEDGIYEITMLSKKPKAREFRHFVRRLLKGLRKGDLTIVPSYQISDPIERAKRWIEEETQRVELKKENKRMKPYATLGESVSDNDTLITVGELARVLKQRGVNIGQNRLFEWLRQEGFLIKRKGSDYNLPTQRALDMKLFRIVKNTATTEDGEEVISRTTKVTGKGQVYFINKLIELTYNQPADNLTLFLTTQTSDVFASLFRVIM